MMVSYEIDLNKPYKLSKEQIDMLDKASKLPITFDEDCPELTMEELKQFKRVNSISKLHAS